MRRTVGFATGHLVYQESRHLGPRLKLTQRSSFHRLKNAQICSVSSDLSRSRFHHKADW